MAFVPPTTLVFSHRHPSLNRHPLPSRAAQPRAPRWTSLARSHPYGNGGIPTELDYTGYDPVKIAAEFEQAAEQFANSPARQTDHLSSWVLILSPEILQWDNNLFKASVEDGFSWDLRDLNLVRLAERTARENIENNWSSLFLVRTGDNEEFLAVDIQSDDEVTRDPCDLLLTFERKVEVDRFVGLLNADGRHATVATMSMDALKAGSGRENLLLGLVPAHSLLSPSQFGGFL